MSDDRAGEERGRKRVPREELERESGSMLPPRETMALVDPEMIGVPPGPDLPDTLPERAEADEHAPIYRIQTEE